MSSNIGLNFRGAFWKFQVAFLLLALSMSSCVSSISKSGYEKQYVEAQDMDVSEAKRRFPKLASGDVQKSKWIYMFQAYISPKKEVAGLYEGPIAMPKDFTGVWNAWDRQGRLFRKFYISEDSEEHYCQFYENGRLSGIMMMVEGKDIVIYSKQDRVDLRGQYTSEIQSFEDMIRKLEIINGIE